MIQLLKSYTPLVVTFLSALTLLGGVLVLGLLPLLIHKSKKKWVARLTAKAMPMMLAVALTATLGSLFFSEISGWVPCKLCWFQRIFMYPQALLILMAIWRGDKKSAPYFLGLSLAGLSISGFHYAEQVYSTLNPVAPLICDPTGVLCAATEIEFAFGYITIPMMAFTAFALMALGSALILRYSKK